MIAGPPTGAVKESGLASDPERSIPEPEETEVKAELCGETDPEPPPLESAPVPERQAVEPVRRSRRWWLDLLLFAVLCAGAFAVRWTQAVGDFWFDEADYAQAAARGFEANRWDLSEAAADPERLVKLRHFHPPLVAQVMVPVLEHTRDERALRLPFILAGSLTVGLVYLCGLFLFRSRAPSPEETQPLRSAALASAVILVFTPALVRAGSHAIPWAFITLWLVGLLYTLLGYARRPHAAWLGAAGAMLGAMAVTSEYLFPTLVACGAGLLGLLARDFRRHRKGWVWDAALGLGAGVLLLAVIASLFWPAGAVGGATKMLRHYVEMADSTYFPVVIEGVTYQRAPKWAYLYWYWTDFPAYTAFYAAGLVSLGVMAARRSLDAPTVVLALFTAVVLAVAHRAHIIGPEYLSHALPFLTLLGGLFFGALARARPAQSLPALAACCWVLASGPEVEPLAGMDLRARIPRWPAAAEFLRERAGPEDRFLASSYAVPARWYLLHAAALPITEDQVRILPGSGAREELLDDLQAGRYRWIVVGNSFSDWTEVDNRIRILLRRWPLVWSSDERGTGPSRLLIYERPRPKPTPKPAAPPKPRPAPKPPR